MDDLTREILYILDIPTLLRIKEQCNRYITYSVDYKQINSKYGVQTRAKKFSELLEEVEALLVIKNFAQKEQNNNSNNATTNSPDIKSSMEKQSTEKKSKKGEKQA